MDTTNARANASRLADLLCREQAAMADFLLALADFDRRRLWEPLGHTSLWYFLHRDLGLSKGAAYHRKVAAELLQRSPPVEAALRDGRLCLSSVVELARVLTAENEAEVLPRFFHGSAREAKEVVAELAPRAVVPERVVVTPVQGSAAVVQTSELTPGESRATGSATPTPTATSTWTPNPPPRPPPTTIDPLTADLRRLHVTVSRRFLDKLEAARDALSHAMPGASAEAILEAGLDLILSGQARRRGQVKRPRAARPSSNPGSSHVPAEVRRVVWTRDQGRCQWPLDSGDICGSTYGLELDHIHPRARGGPSTEANLRVLCDFHNDLAARQAFGNDWMRRFRRSASDGANEGRTTTNGANSS